MLGFLKFQNETSKERHILWFDTEGNNLQKTEIHPKQEKTVVVYKGESTDVFLKKLFFILVFDDTHTIYHQDFMTGREINEQESILIQ